mgnify:CR=1 FL=1
MNIAVEPPTLAYRLVSNDELGCARVEWETGTVDLTATELLRTGSDGEEASDRNEVSAWLEDYIMSHGGSAPAKDVFKAGAGAGYAKHTLQRARKKASVVTKKGSMGSGWSWEIVPEDDTKMTKNTAPSDPSSSSPSVSPSGDCRDSGTPYVSDTGPTGGTTGAPTNKSGEGECQLHPVPLPPGVCHTCDQTRGAA